MKKISLIIPSIKPENVVVVGTPQFEPYTMDIYPIDKNNFFETRI